MRNPGLNRFLPAADRSDFGQWLGKPITQGPRAHRRDGASQHAKQSGVPWGVPVERFQDFEMAQRGAVEMEKVRCLITAERGQVRQVAAEVLPQIMERAADRA